MKKCKHRDDILTLTSIYLNLLNSSFVVKHCFGWHINWVIHPNGYIICTISYICGNIYIWYIQLVHIARWNKARGYCTKKNHSFEIKKNIYIFQN